MMCNGPVWWAAKQQRSNSTSTAQSEYIALSQRAAECLWLRKVCATVLGIKRMPTTNIMEDNTAALKWCYNPVNHAKQKHIPVAYHFIREQVAQFGNINVVPVATEFELADMFTKCLPAPRLRFLIDTILGKHPAPVARPTPTSTSLLDATAEALSDAVKTLQVTL